MSLYDGIVKGLNEAIAYERGQLKGVNRHVVKIAPLPKYKAHEIKRIRLNLSLSQAAFANIIGVSKKTVEAWESGRNIPQGPSQRMLELLDKNGLSIVKKYILL
ncbi:helix-turn-helix domain-containing protein [Desulfoscipio geothermicus]|uniref:Putative transcriptional regulator n=1 Tax=Desulfoscipio geothermicus DSM 3669 TaxID=1121426 RepID=A0A1I6E1C7_9FIRM|nr:helix-turn-helix domain-containing protein [Desulfoscipio geothermicus]SFR11533.1 putative transcriptional regulator [Desulfoscipio geothermicus DSM 3669]